MFDLGYKQIVINSNSVVKQVTTGSVTEVIIEGFGKFEKGKGVAKMSGLGWGLGYLGGILCMIPVYLIISGNYLCLYWQLLNQYKI